ncbi:hypothetical protein BS50DRAFT_506190, partial [Corynespora cassiicola Philippines]
EESLTVKKVSNLITKRESSTYNISKKSTRKVRGVKRCKRYSEKEYNFRICTVEIENSIDSNKSKK